MILTDDNDELIFEDEDVIHHTPPKNSDLHGKTWKILLADDEPQVHEVTTLALSNFNFDNHPLEFFHAYNSEQAIEIMQLHPDIALILLDVVMEKENAGLNAVKVIREVLNNKNVRIVLRTGQPGMAPESEVITKYDINDYKEKTELTSRKLVTLMYSCLRSYRDLSIIQANKKGLEKIVEASPKLFIAQSMERFAQGVLEQIDALINHNHGGVYAQNQESKAQSQGIAFSKFDNEFKVIAGTGEFSQKSGKSLHSVLSPEIQNKINQALISGKNQIENDEFIGVYKTQDGSEKILYLKDCKPESDFDLYLLELFSKNVGVSFENLALREAIVETQREIVFRLGGAVETRSKETGAHVRRVAEISYLLATKYGLSDHDSEVLRYASPMHDVGKVGIPDAILNKPGKLTPEEWEIMQTHTTLGWDLLKDSNQEILHIGGLISLEHHEKWNGKGYPSGKKGTEISIQARITAVADVFDALGSRRCYKEPWPHEKILELFHAEKGEHFDPDLVELLLSHMDEVITLRDKYPDPGC